VKNPEVFAV